ncbi:hypothetical protein AAC387_Pa12g0678 [Persea americana]|eukprot:TRINITY_DN5389_c0_g1_i1.p1 TRINITY_DN5389_c0_g1~~TRINITY_DN5389_c0_g1_i1.p1  ORF type:complete len:929 (+),score=208.80 TRINITY_DN5389_c0_g1_i1:246-3032(+)
MAVKFQQNFFSPRTSDPYFSNKPVGSYFFCKKVLDLNNLLCYRGNLKQRCHLRHALSDHDKDNLSSRWLESRKHQSFCRARTMVKLSPLASTDDGITVNGKPQAGSSNDLEEMRVKLDQSLQGEDSRSGLIQSLHDAARVFELAIKEHSALSRSPWFSKTWLGVDKNAWVKTLSYQAAVYSLLQAASEISSRGRDKDINVFVQRSLLRLSAPLENSIREELSVKQPESDEWFWNQQHPMVVTTFVSYFERDPRFTAATTRCWKGVSTSSVKASDLSLIMLVLTCIAAIMKLGPAKVSCSQFFSMVPDITGRQMDKLVDFVPIHHAYHSMKDVGLCREFLVHFGPRAAAGRVKSDQDIDEISFWVDLVQKQLQRAIDREKIWSRLTTCESIEVLEKDLAIFGFFIALGRSTQSFLSANGFNVIDEPIENFIRYLIGGSVLSYPQLSSISSYQLYVEVVCEELEWLPFYQGNLDSLNQPHGGKVKKQENSPNSEVIPQVLDVCSHWMKSFIKYSTWLENPSSIKAARFLSRGHNMLEECMEECGVLKNEMREGTINHLGERTVSGTRSSIMGELDSFDKALESVEEALKRLEDLLQEIHVSNSNPGKEHLKAACSDLERIRKLKKEAEFLEASFRAKEASLQQGGDNGHSQSSISKQRQYSRRKSGKASDLKDGIDGDRSFSDRVVNSPGGLWSLLVQRSTQQSESASSNLDQTGDKPREQVGGANISMGGTQSEPNEIRRFELLRNELIELEKRVQRSTGGTPNEEENPVDDSANYAPVAEGHRLVQFPKKESIISKSIDKLKETSTDVWQGTQLLAIDVAAAVGLLRRSVTGDELTDKEKKALRRTLTDLASVVPIGILMLLPVTAVGHAAILAAIQRYVPALIPSTYAPERLDLLRQLEKVKEMETSEMIPEESEGANKVGSSPDNL